MSFMKKITENFFLLKYLNEKEIKQFTIIITIANNNILKLNIIQNILKQYNGWISSGLIFLGFCFIILG